MFFQLLKNLLIYFKSYIWYIVLNTCTHDVGKTFFFSLERKLLHAQSQVTNHTEKRMATEKVLSTIANEAAREAIGHSRRQSSSGSNSPALSMFNSTSTQSISYSLGKYILIY